MIEHLAIRFGFEIDDVSRRLDVVGFAGDEAVGELYRFVVDVTCDDAELEFAPIVSRRARLTIDDGGDEPRVVHGVVARVEQGDDAPGTPHARYRVTLVPQIARLDLRRDCRIFQNLSVPDIVRRVIAMAGLPAGSVRLALQGEHAPREYCVQYRESDWQFVSRLLDEAGITTYFEHGRDREVLVLADHRHAYFGVGSNASSGDSHGRPVATSRMSGFRYGEEQSPDQVTLRDYSYVTPAAPLDGRARTGSDSALEVYDYPGNHDTQHAASERARLQLESLRSTRRVARGESVEPSMEAGRAFSLAEHARPSLARGWLLTRVHHEATRTLDPSSTGTQYSNRFECIPDDVPLRPARRTAKPWIRGVQTAIVVGPMGEEIHTDALGRVKVQFHWDRAGRSDENSSCWIRVSQSSAGAGWGSLFIPRVGMEVVVDFLEGDPDRPIVTGCVYHTGNQPPLALPAEKTRSTLRTNSTPGSHGSNELRFEDLAGNEEIYLHGERDWSIRVEHDKTESIAHDETVEVAHDRTETIGADAVESIGANKTSFVAGTHTETIGANENVDVRGSLRRATTLSESHSIGGDKTVDVTGNVTEVVGRDLRVAVGENKVERVARASEENVGSDKTTAVDGAYILQVGAEMSTSVAGDHTENVGGTRKMLVENRLEIVCGTTRVVIHKNGRVTIEGDEITVKSTGSVRVEGSALEVRSRGMVNVRGIGVGIN